MKISNINKDKKYLFVEKILVFCIGLFKLLKWVMILFIIYEIIVKFIIFVH